MLEVLKAISIDVESIHSGSSQPCVMTLANDNGTIVGQYVVKTFKPQTLEQSANTHKEVFGSILAEAFDLNTPKAVLANVGQNIIDLLNKTPRYQNAPRKKGVYFATEYVENAKDYSSARLSKLETWEMATIFAFDVFIRNQDRRQRKPNLFFKDDAPYLIDHELSFATVWMDKPFLEMLKEKEKYWKFVEIDDTHQHLFLTVLRERNKINPVEYDTFREYLYNLDVDLLDGYKEQLDELGSDYEEYEYIKTYLVEVRRNADTFINLLKSLIV